MLRCFEDGDVTHVEGGIDPLRDAETVETELMLADLESLEKRVDNLTKKARGRDKEAIAHLDLVKRAIECSRDGKPARVPGSRTQDEERAFQRAQTADRQAACSMSAMSRKARPRPATSCRSRSRAESAQGMPKGARAVVDFREDRSRNRGPSAIGDRAEFLATVGLDEPGLDRLIRAGYELLGLVTFFTAGPKEARAWTVTRGTQRPAGRGRHPHRFREGLHPRRDDRI